MASLLLLRFSGNLSSSLCVGPVQAPSALEVQSDVFEPINDVASVQKAMLVALKIVLKEIPGRGGGYDEAGG